MRGTGPLETIRARLATPVAPLQGLALLAASAVLGTVVLTRLAQPGEAPPDPARPLDVLAEPVVVHVAGAVARPGVHRLPAGARVTDAIEAAGGATRDADLGRLNLARVLEDGEQVAVPAAGEEAAASGGTRADGRVDLNRATTAELDALPGIGPVLAARIVAYRDQHGGFRSVRDLRRVQGIGEKLYRSLEELLAV